MSVAHKAARGVVWTTGMALVSRAVGLVGTLVLTHFIAPEVMGEVVTASAVAFAINFSTQIGASQYVMLRGDDDPEAVFHVTVMSVALVALPLLLLTLLAPKIAPLLSAQHAAQYVPGMALVVLIGRISSVPDKLLLRRMRFRTVAVANAVGQVTHTIVAVTLVATTALGGMAIVLGHIAQVSIVAVIEIAVCGTAAWLTPTRLKWSRFKEIFHFGLPLGGTTFLYEAARYGDKLVFTRLFGTGRTGEYNLAYSLADLPAIYIGEQVSNVLLPTLLRVDGDRRKNVLVRAIGMLALATFPMAVGLGLISVTLIDVLLPDSWHGVAPFLTVLAALSVFRPINNLLSQYLISAERNRILLSTEVLRFVALFGGMIVFGLTGGPVAAALAVGFAALVQTCALVRAVDPAPQFASGLMRAVRAPFLACLVMTAVVLGLRLMAYEIPSFPEVSLLVLEIAGGAVAYLGALYMVARAETLEAWALAMQVLRPQRGAA